MRNSCSANYVGRLALLDAFDEVLSPSPLADLGAARPAITSWLESQPLFAGEKTRGAIALASTWRALAADSSPAAVAARQALETWRERHRALPPDEWVMSAAVRTLVDAVASSVGIEGWRLLPDRPISAPFLGYDGPLLRWEDSESEEDFRRRARAAFERSLNTYCSRVKAHLGERRGNLERDAEWTARYLAGQTFAAISTDVRGKDPETQVTRAVHRFASDIGLTLPDKRNSECKLRSLKSLGDSLGTSKEKAPQNANRCHSLARA